MMMKLILLLLVVGVVYVNCGKHKSSHKKHKVNKESSPGEGSKSHSSWNYATNGPSTWGNDCKKDKQSPINIITCETTKSTYENRVFSHNYWEKFSDGDYTIINNGHALQINLPADNKYVLTKGSKRYAPVQIHIHFDTTTGKGSEHTLNSRKYFAEIHIVHKNLAHGEEFMKHSDGLLVIGIFVDRVKDKKGEGSDLDFNLNADPEVQIPNDGTSFVMALFAKAAKDITEPESKKPIAAFPLAWLLPKVHRRHSKFSYVNYKGSLTTPPCSEIVDWVVITGNTLEISESTAKSFEKVKNSQQTEMAGNNRPIRELNGRDVYAVKGSL